ncbi:hypothetical protein BDZ45DRAFT_673108 [Acephala macrosclerotiorum]|nr:hypothetical protein BDZ45DRAFT_673108 [Acephala macrosclerotiorum]
MGVFAHEDICLDTRLKYKPDIRGLVMLLLNVLSRNLLRAIKTHNPHAESIDGETEHTTEPIGATYGIDGSIDRLHRLAVRIRQSSKDGLLERVRAFAKKLPSDDSEAIIGEIIRFKYPLVNEELLTHLTRTVLYRRHRLMYIRRHQGKLAHERDQPSQSILEATKPDLIHNIAQPTGDKTQLQPGVSKASFAGEYSETAPSLMNTDVYNQQDNVKQTRPSTTSGSVSSSLTGKIIYPNPPINNFSSSHAICPFCFEEFLVTEFENTLWWRSHVDKDLEHYVCISDECNHSLLYFGSFSSWLDHMNETHTEAWPQFMHTLTTWRCIYPHNNAPVSFETVGELYNHLETDHGQGFNSRELLALAQKSKALKPRNLGTCPLCYEDITRQSVSLVDLESAKSEDAVAAMIPESTTSAKPKTRRVEWTDTIDHGVQNQPSGMKSAPALMNSTKTAGFRLKIAKHVAGHLKSLSFLSLRGLELGTGNESAASNSAVQGFNEGESGSDPEGIESATFLMYGEVSFEDSSEAVVLVDEEDQENRELCLLREPPHDAPEWNFVQRKTDQPEGDDFILRCFKQSQEKEGESRGEEHQGLRRSIPIIPWPADQVDSLVEPSSDGSSVINDLGDANYLSEVQRPSHVLTSSGHQWLTADLAYTGAEFADATDPPRSNELDSSVHSEIVPVKEFPEDDPSREEESLGMSIRAALQRSASRERENFLPLDALEGIVTRNRIRLELANLPTIPPEQLDYLTNQIWQIARLSHSKSFFRETTRRKLFAILSLLQKEGQIVDFINEGLDDSDLPFVLSEASRKGLLQLNRKGEDGSLHSIHLFAKWRIYEIESFDNWQWKLMAPYFQLSTTEDRKILHYVLEARVVLPFIEDEANDNAVEQWGGFGNVWKVKIHPAHCNNKTFQNENPYYALKRLGYNSVDLFKSEVSNLKRFSGRKSHLHLVRLLITFSWREQYYLLFPWADSNLFDFWKRYPYPSNFEQDYYRLTLWFAKQCQGIAEGLKMGQTIDSPDTEGSVPRRHGDLKPENILWFRGCQGKDPTSLMGHLKISDFGLTRFHQSTARASTNQKVMVSPTYRAPEYDVTKMVSQQDDAWALGCILLEFVTWFLMGCEEVDEFSRKRAADDISGIRQDAFFNFYEMEDNQGPVRLCAKFKRSIHDEIKLLTQHQDCSDYLSDLLEFVSNRLLRMSPLKRANCTEVVEYFIELHQRCTTDPTYCTKRVKATIARSGSDLSVISPTSLFISDATRRKIQSIVLPETDSGTLPSPYSTKSLDFDLAGNIPVHNKSGWSVDTPRRSTSPDNIEPETLHLAPPRRVHFLDASGSSLGEMAVDTQGRPISPDNIEPQTSQHAPPRGINFVSGISLKDIGDLHDMPAEDDAQRKQESPVASSSNDSDLQASRPQSPSNRTKSFWKRLQKPFRTEKK